MYIGPDRVLKATKDVEIFINRAKVLEYYCKFYVLLKSTYMISYILLALAVCCFTKIYIDTIEYKFLSTNNYKYIVYLLDRYFNY